MQNIGNASLSFLDAPNFYSVDTGGRIYPQIRRWRDLGYKTTDYDWNHIESQSALTNLSTLRSSIWCAHKPVFLYFPYRTCSTASGLMLPAVCRELSSLIFWQEIFSTTRYRQVLVPTKSHVLPSLMARAHNNSLKLPQRQRPSTCSAHHEISIQGVIALVSPPLQQFLNRPPSISSSDFSSNLLQISSRHEHQFPRRSNSSQLSSA